jgi:hypothetical protein
MWCWSGGWIVGAGRSRIFWRRSRNWHLGVGFVYLTEALDLTTPAGGRTAGIENFHRRLGRTEGRQPRSLSLACCLTARHSWVRAAFRPNCPAGLTDNYGLSYGPAPPG